MEEMDVTGINSSLVSKLFGDEVTAVMAEATK
jgi:hypothetical protein